MSSRIDTPRLVRIHHRLRSFSFAMLFVATGLHIHDKDYGPLAWILLALLFLAYPQVQHWWAATRGKPGQACAEQLLVDSVLLGMYAAAMQFSIWLSFVVIIGTLSNSRSTTAWRGILQSVLGLMAGAVAGIGLFGFSPSLHTGLAAAIYCMIGIVLYVLVTGKLVFDGNIELRNTRKRLRTVLDGVESGVITISEKGIVESFNLSAERMFGYEAAEVVGRNVNMLMPEPFRSGHDGYLENYLRSGVRKVIGRKKEVRGTAQGRAMFHMALDVSEALLNDRRVFIGSVRDISTRKAEETELRIAAAAFESLEGIIVTDAGGTILRVNRAFTENTGYTAEECIGRNPRMLKSRPP
jgi:PAS domain S-box-containing protein